MGKLYYLTFLVLIILLAITSGWFFKSIDTKPILTQEKPRHSPDYFLKNFTSTTIDSNGKPAYKIKAHYLEHYPDDDSMILNFPVFSFYKNNIKIWTAQANKAHIIHNNEKIHLSGHVILNQIQSDNKDSLVILTSEQLTIEPDKNIAYTKTKVHLIKGNNSIYATGMRADMNKNRIEFLSHTRSYYVLSEK